MKALRTLGFIYLEGKEVPIDYKMSQVYFGDLEEKKDPVALYQLGLMEFIGYPYSIDISDGITYMKLSASKGYALAKNWKRFLTNFQHPSALFELAKLYQEGSLLPKNTKKAIDLYKKSVKYGGLRAIGELAKIYEKGIGLPKNPQKALLWHRLAAKEGYMPSMYYVARQYLKRKTDPQNTKKAIGLLDKICTNVGKHKAANFLIATIYHEGKLIKKDIPKALECYSVAAGNGHSKALALLKRWANKGYKYAELELGNYYHYYAGPSTNYAEAHKWYKKAAKQGLASAHHRIGVLYNRGRGVKESKTKAFQWFKKGANLGFHRSQYEMGQKYLLGDGVKEDKKEAAEWYEKAAKQGLKVAQLDLGLMYLDGTGVKKNPKLAAKWILASTKDDYSWANYQVFTLYENGIGVNKNLKKAMHWYKKSLRDPQGPAVRQFPSMEKRWHKTFKKHSKNVKFYFDISEYNEVGMYLLGLSYQKGWGLPKDLKKAAIWYRKASLKGFKKAMLNLALIYEKGLGVPKSGIEAIKWYTKLAKLGNKNAKSHLKRLKPLSKRSI